jgi:hypothetical protein
MNRPRVLDLTRGDAPAESRERSTPDLEQESNGAGSVRAGGGSCFDSNCLR